VVRWIAWAAQTGNAADAATTIMAWPHPWFHESSWLILTAVRLVGPWGGVIAAKLLWALALWGLTAGVVRSSSREEARHTGWGILAGLAGLGLLFWLAAVANVLSLAQHARR
jgi:hypothetical protein